MPQSENSPRSAEVGKASEIKKLQSVPTHVEGVYYRVQDGTDIDNLLKFTKRRVRFLAGKGKTFFTRDQRLKRDEKIQKKEKYFWRMFAQEHPGWRGIISNRERSKFALSVTPQTQVTYDRDLLKESLGETAYKNTVKETLAIDIDIHAGIEPIDRKLIPADEIISDIKKTLMRLGVPESQIHILMKWSINLDVDKVRLQKLIDEGKATLKEGTKSEHTTWRVASEPLRQSMLPENQNELSKPAKNTEPSQSETIFQKDL